MGYTKTNWQTGDTITSAKLNKIEQGIEDAQSKADAYALTFTDTNHDGHVTVAWENPPSNVIAFPASS